MNDQNQNLNSNPEVENPQPVPAPVQTKFPAKIDWKVFVSNVKPVLLNLFNKFYSNKKIFWPVSIAAGFVVLVILLGVIFGKRNVVQVVYKSPTPAPVVQNTPQATPSGNILIDSQKKLNNLKIQINNLDLSQSRLKPPTLDFKISF